MLLFSHISNWNAHIISDGDAYFVSHGNAYRWDLLTLLTCASNFGVSILWMWLLYPVDLAYSSHPLILIHAHILCRLPNNWANHVSDGGSHRWVWLGLSRVRSKTNCHVRFFLCDWRGWLCLDMSLWVYLSLASLHLTLLFPEYYWFTLTSSVFQRHPAECPVHRPVLNPLLTQPRERNFG